MATVTTNGFLVMPLPIVLGQRGRKNWGTNDLGILEENADMLWLESMFVIFIL